MKVYRTPGTNNGIHMDFSPPDEEESMEVDLLLSALRPYLQTLISQANNADNTEDQLALIEQQYFVARLIHDLKNV